MTNTRPDSARAWTAVPALLRRDATPSCRQVYTIGHVTIDPHTVVREAYLLTEPGMGYRYQP
ncbi:MAG: hypothetical protein J2P28_03125 [Actinobacteria bacterium]|nr:hypothetical protein [Actinomycetota bacterium]MBO0830467.1 hypothetical protein [Actinomycetota bacterium]MBO0834496.1 hypothetical protein [Actinomycetota bacterium]